MTLIKRVGGYLAEITISEALEIVTCHWGRWVSEEDVTISKQTFRVELYPLRRPSGQQFCNMVMYRGVIVPPVHAPPSSVRQDIFHELPTSHIFCINLKKTTTCFEFSIFCMIVSYMSFHL